MDFYEAQEQIWSNKLAKGFNTTNVPLEICLLQGEIAELFDEWRKKGPGVADEVADVAIYLLGLAQMLDVDLKAAVERKMHINANRRYVKKHGTLLKAAPAESRSTRQPVVRSTARDAEALLLPFPDRAPDESVNRFG